MRGDRPPSGSFNLKTSSFTPHARGSTLFGEAEGYDLEVYPACAGIDRTSGVMMGRRSRLPRMRGDRPGVDEWLFVEPSFTPHARGSTVHLDQLRRANQVYPACAGIDLFTHHS